MTSGPPDADAQRIARENRWRARRMAVAPAIVLASAVVAVVVAGAIFLTVLGWIPPELISTIALTGILSIAALAAGLIPLSWPMNSPMDAATRYFLGVSFRIFLTALAAAGWWLYSSGPLKPALVSLGGWYVVLLVSAELPCVARFVLGFDAPISQAQMSATEAGKSGTATTQTGTSKTGQSKTGQSKTGSNDT